ncbi:[trimethylamine--corrinoid protein] Co-methyltransferase [Methanococcoides sp. SA1]|nr:[trimethylamine--corrinoid protein] Co-methyltransferase [Methanococcoides sp. SA1]
MVSNDITSKRGIGLGMLSKTDLDLITQATAEVLETVGIHTDDPEALGIYAEGGCDVDRENGVVLIPEHLVMDTIRYTPSKVRFAGFDRKKDVMLRAGPEVHWGPFGVGVQILEYSKAGNTSVRPTTEDDLRKSVIISDWCDNYDVADPTVTGDDWIDKGRGDLHELSTSLINTTKPTTYGSPEEARFDDYVELNRIAYGGDEELARKRPLLKLCYCPTSPLDLCDNVTQLSIKCANNMIPSHVISMALAGATGPVTLAGTLVTQNAEVLASMALSQLANRGAPVVYGSANTIMDLKSGTASVGSPELALLSSAVAQLAQYYKIPTASVMGGWTDSKVPDVQVGAERGLAMLPALAGANLIMAGGVLDGGMTISLEQLVVDNDIFGTINHLLKGFDVTEENIRMNDIKKVGIGKHYLALASTRAGITGQSNPLTFDRNMRGPWENQGSKTALDLAHEKVEWILENHDPCGLDGDVVKEMNLFVAGKDKEFLMENGR